eukprot:TRINITY_DN49553_c0_g1_i1.p1 TRINITY_DN49553_c0_g1~~TRINITY_DN49553_c0_g1_i1.p1  ORF type:complete len:555 (+),score=16.37 TRINITY_DN49553_c0_g1_i1:82-1665(+)
MTSELVHKTKSAVQNVLTSISLVPASHRTCKFELQEDALRGVCLRETLSGFGHHWQSSHGDEAEYELSKPVARINYFLSHCWSTPRLRKTLALLYYNNMRAAVMMSLLHTLCVMLLRHRDVFGETTPFKNNGKLSGTTSLPVFLVVFFTWHHIPALLGRHVMVFLDKLCIHQTDAQKKAEGIMALGAFMNISDRVVVLWAEEYFTRLWCTYELAAWERLGRDFEETVRFVPVFARCATLVCAIFSIVQVVDDYVSQNWETKLHNQIWQFAVGGCLNQFVLTHLVRASFHEFRDIRTHAQDYDFHESKCFCCTVGHRHPETGAPLLCDRKLVLRTIRSWYDGASKQGADEDIVDVYQQRVRSHLIVCSETVVREFCSYSSLMSFDVPVLNMYFGVWISKLMPLFAFSTLTDSEFEGALREMSVWAVSAVCTRPLSRRLLFALAQLVQLDWADRWKPLQLLISAGLAVTYSALYFGVHYSQKSFFATAPMLVVAVWSGIQILVVICVFALPSCHALFQAIFRKGDRESE